MAIDIATLRLDSTGMLPQYKPTPAEEKIVRDAVAFLVIRSPFFAHLLYSECVICYSELIPIAATDGKYQYYNTRGEFANMTIAERAFVIAHETAHCMFGDLLMSVGFRHFNKVPINDKDWLPYSDELMNHAEDYRINAMLIESKIGSFPKIGLYDPALSKAGMESAVDIYAKLFQQGGGGGGGGGSGFDIHLEPSKKQQKAESAGQRTQAIAAALAAAEATGQGIIPNAVKRLLGELLEPKVPWQDQIRSAMVRAGGDPAYDWRTIDRRLLVRPDPIYFARQEHTGAGLIIIGIDTSGSITNRQIERFFSETQGIINDLNPSQLLIIWCDAEVNRIDDLDEPDDLSLLKADVEDDKIGGGGTSFNPVFKHIEEEGLQPDMLVYFTDGYANKVTHAPNYPVVWGIISGGRNIQDFGAVIEVEL
jgi:predicted metal-dependent peptidase